MDDPTRPPRNVTQAVSSQPEAVVSLKLEAVLQSGKSRTAVINGKAIKQGQQIQGAIVQEIHPRSVVLSQDDGGEQKTITLWVSKRGNVKTNAAENY
ncbi:hypothetical protein GCM10011338_38870 [Alteromonas lipolytica]|nr:hypothetical protein GCM10011338_38870 [Alteromonas lipolytica]